MENCMFWSEIGWGFSGPGCTLKPKNSMSTPPFTTGRWRLSSLHNYCPSRDQAKLLQSCTGISKLSARKWLYQLDISLCDWVILAGKCNHIPKCAVCMEALLFNKSTGESQLWNQRRRKWLVKFLWLLPNSQIKLDYWMKLTCRTHWLIWGLAAIGVAAAEWHDAGLASLAGALHFAKCRSSAICCRTCCLAWKRMENCNSLKPSLIYILDYYYKSGWLEICMLNGLMWVAVMCEAVLGLQPRDHCNIVVKKMIYVLDASQIFVIVIIIQISIR